ncbi:MAG: formylglycine-generating enzyme family protein [Candidatus Latescibacteria bacterium]|jgi:formylglycine-generating enzyme required for sulfatase activity|nr:formylglycine-generating enzyme family protein [Candidatus Latescibacterota bacterium]
MNKTGISFFLFVLLILMEIFQPQSSYAQGRDYGLAVLDLQANGIAESEALALSDVLRSSILNVIQEQADKIQGSYKLIERSQMNRIFDEFDVQNIGCTDVSCAIEFGKMLNAERVIIGSVGLVGSTYIVVARIVDVESTNMLVSVNRNVPSPIDNVIGLMPIVGHELLTSERLAAPVATLQITPSDQSVTPLPEPSQPVVPAVSSRIIAGIKIVSIPGGNFQMGSDNSRDEKPMHTIALDGFEMSSTEITQKMYRNVMGEAPSEFIGNDNFPVEKVSWFDAVKFCNQLSVAEGIEPCYNLTTWKCDFTSNGFRLPTEAEWEYACRAGTETDYYTGDGEKSLINAGWFKKNSDSNTHPVEQREPNAWELYDMYGNVWEWCHDYYGKYNKISSRNPEGAQSGKYHVIRGGSYRSKSSDCRTANRQFMLPNVRQKDIGFRVVRRPAG